MLDSGAQVSSVDVGALRELFATAVLAPIDEQDPLLRGAGGERLKCRGKLRDVRVRIGESWLVVPTLYAIDGLRYPLLIGINDVSCETDFAVRCGATKDDLEIRVGSSGWVHTERLRERRPRYVHGRPTAHFDQVSLEKQEVEEADTTRSEEAVVVAAVEVLAPSSALAPEEPATPSEKRAFTACRWRLALVRTAASCSTTAWCTSRALCRCGMDSAASIAEVIPGFAPI